MAAICTLLPIHASAGCPVTALDDAEAPLGIARAPGRRPLWQTLAILALVLLPLDLLVRRIG